MPPDQPRHNIRPPQGTSRQVFDNEVAVVAEFEPERAVNSAVL
jgi:hypothetical protein